MKAAVVTGVPAMTVTVADVMTRCPISVPVDTPFQTIARALSYHRISAVPVVDRRGRPVGVVSEADLIGAGWDATARKLMTSPVRTVDADVTLPTASRMLAEAGVRRLFVVERGRLAGVLSRRDLLTTYLRDDDVIRDEVERQVRPLLEHYRAPYQVSVQDGVVLLLGRVEWRDTLAVADERVRAVPGVVEVRNRLGYVFTGPVRSTQ
jgi:CBS domain-containing protein